jgi:hypothetical protein
MSQGPPIRRVRAMAPPKDPKPQAAPAPPTPDAFPAESILAAFDSWVGNMAQKHGLPAKRIRALVYDDTDPRMWD